MRRVRVRGMEDERASDLPPWSGQNVSPGKLSRRQIRVGQGLDRCDWSVGVKVDSEAIGEIAGTVEEYADGLQRPQVVAWDQ